MCADANTRAKLAMTVRLTSRNHDGCFCTVCSQVECRDGRSSRFDRVSDIGQPHDAVVSRTATMMGASVEQAGRWNIEMVELHISTVCQILDSCMLGVVTALFSTMCQNQIPTSNSLHTCM